MKTSAKNWTILFCLHVSAGSLLLTAPCLRADEEKPIVVETVELGRPVDFDKDIAPILQANCVACHNRGKAESELNLENAAAILKGGAAGVGVVAGKPEESYVFKLAARTEEPQMPPWPNNVKAQKLTPRELGILRQWIIEGAKGGATNSAASMQWKPINSRLKAVYAVAADASGRYFAAGRANEVTVYDMQAKDQIRMLVDPSIASEAAPRIADHDYVHSIAFHPDGQLIATGGFQSVKLWERDLKAAVAAVKLPAASAWTAVSSDGKRIASHQQDGTIRIVDTSTDAVVRELPGFDPAATRLLGIHGAEGAQISVVAADGTVQLINVADAAVLAVSTPLEVRPLQAAMVAEGNRLFALLTDGSLRPLAFDAAAKTLTAGDVVKSDKGIIRQISMAGAVLVALADGAIVELRKTDSLQPTVTITASGPLASAALSGDAARVITVTADGKPELWNAADGKLVATLTADLPAARRLKQREMDKSVRDARINVVKGQITEDEKRVTEHKESLKKGEEELTKTTTAQQEAQKKQDEAVTAATAAKTASGEKPDDAELKKKLEEADKAVQAAKDAFVTAENALKSAMKGKQLSEQAIQRAEATVAERKVQLTAAETEASVATAAHQAADVASKVAVTSVLAAFVGNTHVATTDATGTLRLWNSADGSAQDVMALASDASLVPVRISSLGSSLLAEQKDGQLARWNVFPGWKIARVMGPQGEDQPSVFVDRVLSLAFSPDGLLLAAGGGEASRSGELTLWNVADGKLVRNFTDAHSDTVYGLDFSADGRLLASAAADKFVKVFDVASGTHVRSYEGHTHHVMDVSWQADRTTLASAGADNAIKVWNAETGEQARTITTYTKQVTSLSFIGMKDEFLSCSGDKRVFLHKASNGGTVREFKGCPDYVYCSATTADGSVIVAGCEDGMLRVWNGNDAKEIATFAPDAPK